MIRRITFLVSIVLVSTPPCAAAQPLFFDDHASNEIRVQNAYYQIAFSKTNGCITRIVDRSTGRILSSGTSDGHLWHAQLSSGHGIGGADYDHSSARDGRFSYRWYPSKQQLVLDYMAGDSSKRRLSHSPGTSRCWRWLASRLPCPSEDHR